MLTRLVRCAQTHILRGFATVFTPDHEYITDDGVCGITDHAQDALGEIIHLEFICEAGEEVDVGDAIAEIESVKSVSEVYSPCTGVIAEINEKLMDDDYVSVINEDAEAAGWMFKFEEGYDLMDVLDEVEYAALCEEDH